MANPVLPEVFTARDVARAAGVREEVIIALVDAGVITALPGSMRVVYLDHSSAVLAGRAALESTADPALGRQDEATGARPTLFATSAAIGTRARTPFALSSLAHAAALAALVVGTWTVGSASTRVDVASQTETRLVYLTVPGPGGGGGGGGARRPAPARKALRRGNKALSSPVPARPDPPAPRPAEPVPPAPLPPEPVDAPIASVPADEGDQSGVVDQAPANTEEGPGSDQGAGAGEGQGSGDGRGDGLGDGENGGTGGGPFRPGSGVEPPSILREIKPVYTEAARQRGIQGDVLLEIVVQRDGRVGDVRVIRGLGHGLEQRAIDAVRQWRFSPARRRGTPVDVLVEVAMEFRLR